MNKHTPGPWAVNKSTKPYTCIGGATGTHDIFTVETAWIHGQLRTPVPIIILGKGLPEKEGDPLAPIVWIREADAILISSAPELLEALEAYVKRFEDGPESVGFAGYEEVDTKARAAIAKAYGENK